MVTKPEALKGDVGEPNKFLGQTPGLRRTSFSGKPRAMRVVVVVVAAAAAAVVVLLVVVQYSHTIHQENKSFDVLVLS